MLQMPDGQLVKQGSQEDKATWWTCTVCDFTGPYVGTDDCGWRCCMGIICGGVDQNPNIPRLPKEDPQRKGTWLG